MSDKKFKCQLCPKTYRYKSDLRRHVKAMHKRASIDPSKIVVSDEKIEYLPSKILKCPKCEFVLPNEDAVGTHLSTSHTSTPYRHTCFVCLKPFYTNAELQKHMQFVHAAASANSKDDDVDFPAIVKGNFIFNHPFSMIVAGPSRCGKTYWIINLLLNAAERIIPMPTKIVYCYTHWQPKYDILKKRIPGVEWHEGMPTKPYLDEISNAILILDDLMGESVNNDLLMSIFTERSHHQNISVILLMQNLYHQGKNSVSIARNTQYLVLFRNPRDRHEIKTLAMQMFPEKWRKFLEKFDHETKKPRGKLILDFSPYTSDENRIVKSCELTDFVKKAQQQQAITNNPYYAKAISEKSRIKQILDDPSLTNPQKEIEYGQAMNNYSQYMKKAEPISSSSSSQLLSPVLTNKIQTSPKPPTSTITKPTTMSTGYIGTMDDILNLPYEPPRPIVEEDDGDFKEKLNDLVDLPKLTDSDYEEDSGDENHMDNFVSLSDDEKTVNKKQARAEYNFRERVCKKRKNRSKPYEKIDESP